MAASTVLGNFPSFQPGFRLVDAGEVQQFANFDFGVRGGVVGTTAPGPVLSPNINVITGGGAASNVMLPPAVPGLRVVVVNTQTTAGQTVIVNANTANPNTGAADVVVNAASVTMVINSSSMFMCYTPGRWVQYVGTGAV